MHRTPWVKTVEGKLLNLERASAVQVFPHSLVSDARSVTVQIDGADWLLAGGLTPQQAEHLVENVAGYLILCGASIQRFVDEQRHPDFEQESESDGPP